MKKITFLIIFVFVICNVKAISPDPLTLSNWETGTTTQPTYVWTNTKSVIVDPLNGSNHILKLDRDPTVATYQGAQWNNSVAPFIAGVALGNTSASQYKYIVVKAKKSTAYDIKVKLEAPVNATLNIITLTSINASVSGQWVTYIFDAGLVNNTHKQFSIFPEFGGNTGAVTTYIDDIYFTNTLPTVTFTTYKFPLNYTTGTGGATLTKTYDVARSATNIDITLLNTQPIPGATSYNVYDGATKLTSTYDATKNVIKITGLTRSTNYNLQITGVDASAAESAKSDIIPVSTRSNTGTGYEIIDDCEGGALGWNANSGGGALITQNVTNPVTNGYNTSSKCIKLNTQSGSNYYTNAAINNERILSGISNANYRYLHVKILRPSQAAGSVAIKLFSGGGQVSTVSQEIASSTTASNDGAWHDYVFDLGSATATVESYYRGLFIMPNKLASGNQPSVLDYFIDDIYLNNDATLSTANLSTVNIPVTISTSGSIATTTGARGYLSGDLAVVTATPNTNYRFTNWTLGSAGGAVQSTSSTYSFTVSSSTSLFANSIATWTYTATSSDVTKGTVSGTGVYDAGASVTLIATPTTGYRFVNWADGSAGGASASTSTSYTFASAAHKSYFANFVQQFVVSASAGTGGTITSGAGTYDSGATATVVATADAGYRFVNWTLNTSGGAVQSTLASYPFTVSSAKTLVANFVQQFVISASAGTGGSITSGAGTYDSGASVSVVATADAGYVFNNWTDGGSPVSSNATYTFTASTARTLVANFLPAKTFTVTVPAGTAHVYIVWSFTQKSWDATASAYELTRVGVTNQFTGTFACDNSISYKYLCENLNDYDYQAAVSAGGVSESNRSYSVSDNVAAWYRMKTVTLNVSFATATIPSNLFVKGGWDSWTTPIELTKSGTTFSTTISGFGSKFPANVEYKYYTNDGSTSNYECNSDGSGSSNRWAISPTMTDQVARFLTAPTIQPASNTNLSVLGLTNTQLGGTDLVVSSGELTLDQSPAFHSITVSPGAKVTLGSGQSLSASTFTLQSNSTATATFVDNTTNSPQAITATVQQYLPQGRNWYVTSPIGSGTTANLATGTSVVSYSESTAAWVTETGALTAGRGYISVSATGTQTNNISFAGTLNTGVVTVGLTRLGATKSGFNLVGNPYPSYLDWSLVDTTAAKISSTFWYRTKTLPDVNLATTYTFDTFNGNGNVATSNGATTVTNLIPPMQAFWVRVNAGQTAGTLTFTNAMRKHADVVGNKMKAPAKQNSLQSLLRLKVSNGINSDEAIVFFNPNASDGLDDYDSPKMTNGNAVIPEIYTLAGSEQLVINGLNQLVLNQEIPLGFTTGQLNTFTINASEIQNFDSNTQIILKDKLLNKEQLLTVDAPYSFTSDITSSTNRFSIIFRLASVTTGMQNAEDKQEIAIYKTADNQITVHSLIDLNTQSNISVYNAIGQEIIEKRLYSPVTVLENKLKSGVYLVVVTNGTKIVNGKIVIN